MSNQSQSLAEINRRAIEVLSRELGIADTIRFINQFKIGTGDYMAERDTIFEGASLDWIVAEIKSRGANGLSSDCD